MNVFSKKFWHHFSKGWTKNPITDFFSDYAKESGLQTEAEDEYSKLKHSSPDAIEERAHQLGDAIDHSGDNTDIADASTNAAVDAGLDAGVDAAVEGAVDGAILEEEDSRS
ncbi:MAG: hypothetical protein OXD01_04950 [Gammaproteobacteria bacterium]|nr:hypothetical protein [Gammaproteobacteria bacterium]